MNCDKQLQHEHTHIHFYKNLVTMTPSLNVLLPLNLKYNMNTCTHIHDNTYTHIHDNTYTRIHEHTQTQTEGRGDEPMQHEHDPTFNMNTSTCTCKKYNHKHTYPNTLAIGVSVGWHGWPTHRITWNPVGSWPCLGFRVHILSRTFVWEKIQSRFEFN